MRSRALLVLAWAVGCATPAPPAPAPPSAPAPVLSASASSPPAPSSTPVAELLPDAPPSRGLFPGQALPIHRFAALDPGAATVLYPTLGRPLLRTGGRLYALSPGHVAREAAIERAVGLPARFEGAIGGRYPDDLLADRPAPPPPREEGSLRQYLRVRGEKASPVAPPVRDAGVVTATSALEIVALPRGRVLARLEFVTGDGGIGWLDLAPAPRPGIEEDLEGIVNAGTSAPILLARANGSVVLAQGRNGNAIAIVRWAADGSDPTRAERSAPTDERPLQLVETTEGALFLLTSRALYRDTGAGLRPEDPGAPIERAFPLPGGALLLVTDQGEPMVRSATGAFARAGWPVVAIEGRRLPVTFAAVVCTREAGFWGIAENGLGLFHDQAPPELLALGASRPSAAPAASKGKPRSPR